MSQKNIGQKLDEVAADVAEIKGSISVLANNYKHTSEEIKKVEGRQWGLVVALLFAFLTAIMAFALGRPQLPKIGAAVRAAYEYLSF